jgi:hypothetical protein
MRNRLSSYGSTPQPKPTESAITNSRRAATPPLSIARQGQALLVRSFVEVLDDHPSLDEQKDNFSKSLSAVTLL